MSGGGNGRRGRRGGRRQRKREELQRAQRAAENGAAPAAPAAPTPAPEPAATIEPPHPPPLSARALVARLEAMRAHGDDHDHDHDHDQDHDHDRAPAPAIEQEHEHEQERDAQVAAVAPVAAFAPARVVEPRHFMLEGAEWIARLAGTGTGGTGHVAIGRIESIRFALAAEPDFVAAEVLVPRARLDEMYDDELIEMLEKALGAGKRNG